MKKHFNTISRTLSMLALSSLFVGAQAQSLSGRVVAVERYSSHLPHIPRYKKGFS